MKSRKVTKEEVLQEPSVPAIPLLGTNKKLAEYIYILNQQIDGRYIGTIDISDPDVLFAYEESPTQVRIQREFINYESVRKEIKELGLFKINNKSYYKKLTINGKDIETL